MGEGRYCIVEMQWTERNRRIKYVLVAVAVLLAGISLLYSHLLVRNLEEEAHSQMKVWAAAMHSLNTADANTDLNLVLKVINTNNTIPIVVLDEDGEVVEWRNLDMRAETAADSAARLEEIAGRMLESGDTIRIYFDRDDDEEQAEGREYRDIVYSDSVTLRRLAVFPFIQLMMAGVFVVLVIVVLLSLKRAEQNRVWAGLSKETAHQLGTPLTSLMAWVEILKDKYPDDEMVGEMGRDLEQLQLVAERFSKVGSQPEYKRENLLEVLWRVVDYMSLRSSDKVEYVCEFPSTPVMAKMNAPLFEWVVENLFKNAIDAMEGRGTIKITVHELAQINIEVADTGKGIPRNRWSSVFEPGYTTKKRGWGLGLSLAKRIVESYHHGRIYVKSSEMGKGTVFRIELKKSGGDDADGQE